MELNIHPILVHFPIAFLTGYTIFEFARFPFLTRQSFYFYTKTILLFFGVVATVPAILTGLLAQHNFTDHALINLHQDVNLLATAIFFVLAVGYLIVWINHNTPLFLKRMWWWKIKVRVAHLLIETPFVFLIALIGFGVLLIGGTLGGIIVYGPNLDPFTHFISILLKIQ